MDSVNEYIYAEREFNNFTLGTTSTIKVAASAKMQLDSIIAQIVKLRGTTDLNKLNSLKSSGEKYLRELNMAYRMAYTTSLRSTYISVLSSIKAEQARVAAKAASLTQQMGNISTIAIARPPRDTVSTREGSIGAIAALAASQMAMESEMALGSTTMGMDVDSDLDKDAAGENGDKKGFFAKNKLPIILVGAAVIIGAGIYFMKKK